MSKAGIAGMGCAADDMFTIAESLTPGEWHAPSAASGWSVGDVICHIGCLLELLQAAVRGDSLPASGIEALNDTQVAQRRDWQPARVLEYVHTQLDSALPVFSGLQEEPMASVHTQMLDLGSYPLHAIADMFTFDITTHLRYDVLSPLGSAAPRRSAASSLNVVAIGRDSANAANACPRPHRAARLAPHWSRRTRSAHQR
jgi:uncharacterized protein (TIGR03083 family)